MTMPQERTASDVMAQLRAEQTARISPAERERRRHLTYPLPEPTAVSVLYWAKASTDPSLAALVAEYEGRPDAERAVAEGRPKPIVAWWLD